MLVRGANRRGCLLTVALSYTTSRLLSHILLLISFNNYYLWSNNYYRGSAICQRVRVIWFPRCCRRRRHDCQKTQLGTSSTTKSEQLSQGSLSLLITNFPRSNRVLIDNRKENELSSEGKVHRHRFAIQAESEFGS